MSKIKHIDMKLKIDGFYAMKNGDPDVQVKSYTEEVVTTMFYDRKTERFLKKIYPIDRFFEDVDRLIH